MKSSFGMEEERQGCAGYVAVAVTDQKETLGRRNQAALFSKVPLCGYCVMPFTITMRLALQKGRQSDIL